MSRRGAPWLLVAACTAAPPAADQDAQDSDSAAPSETGDPGGPGLPSFRLVVEPAEPERDGRMWPAQTFGPFLPGPGLTLDLEPALEIEGRLFAETLTPWGVAPIPTEPFTVSATLRFAEIGGRATAVAHTGDDGRFAAPLLGGLHTLRVRADDPRLPAGERTVAAADGTPLDVALGTGHALYGRVLDADGTPAVGVEVRAVGAGGFESGVARTDAAGTYEVRVLDGSWTVRVSPPVGRADPVLVSGPLTVEGNDVASDLEWSDVRAGAADLTLVDLGGLPVAATPVRITSNALDGYALGAAEVVVEARTDSRGLLALRVPPGVYVVEVVPEPKQRLGPVRVADVRLGDATPPDPIVVPSRRNVSAVVRDASGEALRGAHVRCTERLVARRVTEADSGADGTARLLVAPTPHRCVVQPPAGRPDLAPLVTTVADPTAALVLQLAPGSAVDGTVRLLLPTGATPAAWATVRVLDDDGNALGFGATDPDGAFAIRYGASPEP